MRCTPLSTIKVAVLVGVLILRVKAVAIGQEQPLSTSKTEINVDNVQLPAMSIERERWLLICCGLPGDDGHRERLTKACRALISASEPRLGVPSARLRVLVGDGQMQEAISDVAENIDLCTKTSVKTAIDQLSESVPQDASCWIVLLGHAHLYRQRCQFNVAGEDFDHNQFGEWSKQLSCREQVFLVTLPVSGFWIRPLRAPSRVVISATEADLEFTGTEMPYALADVISNNGSHAILEDLDGDGTLSLLDLYLAVNLEIHGRFKARERLQTEHSQLDDNGDGRGSELQSPYLPKDEPETAADEPTDETLIEKPKIITNPNLDGFWSRQVQLKPIGD